MLRTRPQDNGALEAISRSEPTRTVLLRLAALERAGGMNAFLAEVESDRELDEPTKDALRELAASGPFLVAAEDYLLAATAGASG